MIVFGVMVAIIVVFVFINKLYYPSLPITGISPKEVIEKLNTSDSKIVQIADEGNSHWYITRTENKGTSISDDNIKQLITSNGWEFKEKDGSGLFFERDNERLIVTTQMWTGKYVLVNIPKF